MSTDVQTCFREWKKNKKWSQNRRFLGLKKLIEALETWMGLTGGSWVVPVRTAYCWNTSCGLGPRSMNASIIPLSEIQWVSISGTASSDLKNDIKELSIDCMRECAQEMHNNDSLPRKKESVKDNLIKTGIKECKKRKGLKNEDLFFSFIKCNKVTLLAKRAGERRCMGEQGKRIKKIITWMVSLWKNSWCIYNHCQKFWT